MERLAGKAVLLTGGANGMGEMHVRRLVAEGARVLFTDVNVEAGQALAESVGERGIFAQQDVSQEADWVRIVELAVAELGGIDVLINNAGIHSFGSLEEENVERLRQVLDVNVAGTWLGIQKVAPIMRADGGGSIINLSSMAGYVGMPHYTVYSSSKWAVRGITKCAASELGADNIRVNAILPGAIDQTGMFNSAEAEAAMERLSTSTPLARVGERDEVSSLVVFLASDESAFITGADHLIDGGNSLS
ncbi:glucose 1-dehydrogenase [Halieaceae bacterium IMCC14734]|uniref:Glucose 1-dehydrogenase n=1 Tax=Candidatus Litorirhabdus singularis TaxID=2518993 RepID=A0ABT3TIW0_9GAMM|nr:glucose 1-dehydrogenase [Candidatus Litorirhabdus singularis]MCX2982221.1 glucose 1-dehydrogenase [Candidatus Litorirhabdus singularis]